MPHKLTTSATGSHAQNAADHKAHYICYHVTVYQVKAKDLIFSVQKNHSAIVSCHLLNGGAEGDAQNGMDHGAIKRGYYATA